MRKTLMHALRLSALGGLLACSTLAAHARGFWSVDLNLGFPVYGSPAYASYPAYGPGYGTVTTALPAGAVSVQVGGGTYWRHGGFWYRPWGPRWVIVAPPVVVAQPAPVVVEQGPPPVVLPPSKPDPVIYPRNGQSAEQTEADRQECNRWATTQPAAMADAAVFHRAVEACMDARGYTMK